MTRKWACATLLVAAVAAVSLNAHAQPGSSPLLPPNANFRGKSFEEWNVLYAEWAIATNLGGQSPSNTVKGVRFLPNQLGAPGAYEFNVTLKPGTPFVAPPFPVFGEAYDNGTQDDPNDPIIEWVFENTDVVVELDGQTLMDGTAAELANYRYGPVDFNPPIVYAEPQDRGFANAIAATVTLGVGAVYRPLPVGQHTLVNTVSGPLGDYTFTYHITVSPN